MKTPLERLIENKAKEVMSHVTDFTDPTLDQVRVIMTDLMTEAATLPSNPVLNKIFHDLKLIENYGGSLDLEPEGSLPADWPRYSSGQPRSVWSIVAQLVKLLKDAGVGDDHPLRAEEKDELGDRISSIFQKASEVKTNIEAISFHLNVKSFELKTVGPEGVFARGGHYYCAVRRGTPVPIGYPWERDPDTPLGLLGWEIYKTGATYTDK